MEHHNFLIVVGAEAVFSGGHVLDPSGVLHLDCPLGMLVEQRNVVLHAGDDLLLPDRHLELLVHGLPLRVQGPLPLEGGGHPLELDARVPLVVEDDCARIARHYLVVDHLEVGHAAEGAVQLAVAPPLRHVDAQDVLRGDGRPQVVEDDGAVRLAVPEDLRLHEVGLVDEHVSVRVVHLVVDEADGRLYLLQVADLDHEHVRAQQVAVHFAQRVPDVVREVGDRLHQAVLVSPEVLPHVPDLQAVVVQHEDHRRPVAVVHLLHRVDRLGHLRVLQDVHHLLVALEAILRLEVARERVDVAVRPTHYYLPVLLDYYAAVVLLLHLRLIFYHE